MRINLRLALFIIIFALSAQARTLESSSFDIYQSGFAASAPVKIGGAIFKKEQLNYNGKSVIYFTVDVKYRNMGTQRQEKYESVSSADDLSLIYYRFQNFNNKSISSIKTKNKMKTYVTYGDRNHESTEKINTSVFPSTLLYLKLAKSIGTSNKSIKYAAIDEEKLSASGRISQGKAIYRGEKKESDGSISHVFINSFGGEKSVILFDRDKKLRKIEFIKPGASIVFQKTS